MMVNMVTNCSRMEELPDSCESLDKCLVAILQALNSMHECRFCHRDVHWANMLKLAYEC